MGFLNSKTWDKAFSTLDSVMDDVSKEINKQKSNATKSLNNVLGTLDSAIDEVSDEIKKQSRQARKYYDDNKGDVYDEINQTIRFIDKSLDYTAGKAYRQVKNVVIKAVNQIVDLLFIKKKAQECNPDAIKILILEKKRNAVNVGIFDEYGNMDQRITIHSDYEISNDVYKGMVVNL